MSIPILKFRDKDGNISAVPAIKGDKGDKGLQGAKGDKGDPGADGYSPTITVKKSTDTEYILSITDKNSNYDTPNLKGQDGENGITEIPIATPTTIGGVMPIAKTDEMTQPVGVDENGRLFGIGNNGERYRLIATVPFADEVPQYTIEKDLNNQPFKLTEVIITMCTRGLVGSTSYVFFSFNGSENIILSSAGLSEKNPYVRFTGAITNDGKIFSTYTTAINKSTYGFGVSGTRVIGAENMQDSYITSIKFHTGNANTYIPAAEENILRIYGR